MDWRDEGFLISTRAHGEGSAVIEVFSALHGRHAGLVRGGASRKMVGVLQPGTQLDLAWRARLEGQLGSFSVEPLRIRAGALLDDRLALLALGSVCALCRFALPERAPYPGLYASSVALLDQIGAAGWLNSYAQWELRLLDETGFGLDLTQCAVTGASSGLAYVSPRTGRAVTPEGAGDFAARLLPLPPGLTTGQLDHAGLSQALALTGHFLHTGLADAIGRRLPEARARLIAALADSPG
jgi:DNA repair protein RecO (recombination protein O)